MLETLIFALAAVPLSIYAGFSDLKTMRIPNWISIALVCTFIVVGLIFLPFETFLWRLAGGIIVLVIGFILNVAGLMGGGDAKFGAAIAPFIAHRDIAAFMLIFSVSLIATLVVHRIAMRIGPIRRATPDWASWKAGRYFPMGISIAAALIFYLTARVFSSG